MKVTGAALLTDLITALSVLKLRLNQAEAFIVIIYGSV